MAGTNLQSARVAPAFQGQDSESSPEYVDGNRAPLVQNWLPGRSGKLVMRGPLKAIQGGNVNGAGEIYPTGIWQIGSSRLVHFPGQQWLANTDTGTQVSADSTLSGAASYAAIGTNVYGPSWWTPATPLLRWDGSTGITKLTNGPYNANAVKTYLNRLFVLDGSVPGGSTSDDWSALYWSDALDNGPASNTLAEWQDDTSGLVNQIRFGNQYDYGKGMAQIGYQALALLRRNSVWLLYGQTPDSFTLRRATITRGCLDGSSIVEYGEGCFYMSDDGYVFFDGASTTVVSGPVQSKLVAVAKVCENFVATKVPGDFILITCSSGNSSGPYSLYSAMFHIPTGAWMELTAHPDIFDGDIYPDWCDTDDTAVSWIYKNKRFWDVSQIGLPEVTITSYPLGHDTSKVVGGVDRQIPAKFWSRVLRLSSPMEMSQLHRLLFDYCWQLRTTPYNETATSAKLQVSAVAGDGTVLVPPTDLTSLAEGATPQRQRRAVQDYSEATEIQIRVEVSSGDPVSLSKAEIYDATVVYQAARQR